MRASVLAFFCAVTALFCVFTLTPSDAGAQVTSAGEARARAIVAAFSAGDSAAFERGAQANYSAAALARRQPEQRAQTIQQIHDSFGALTIDSVESPQPNQVVIATRGARGGQATFTFTLGAAPDAQIESVSIQTQGVTTAATQRRDNPYAPYAFLIGEWVTPTSSGAPEGAIHQSLRWGPDNSYIWYAVYVGQSSAGEEDLHQEGLMTFNAANNNLDFLFVHEPGSFGEEQGSVHAEADGSIVRETTMVGGDGVTTRFRQTWRSTGPNSAVTSLMQQSADGSWAPNFPGSDNLIMTRQQS